MFCAVADLPIVVSLLGEHDDGGALLLPDHPPEVVLCVGQRALRGNELSYTVVALPEKK